MYDKIYIPKKKNNTNNHIHIEIKNKNEIILIHYNNLKPGLSKIKVYNKNNINDMQKFLEEIENFDISISLYGNRVGKPFNERHMIILENMLQKKLSYMFMKKEIEKSRQYK